MPTYVTPSSRLVSLGRGSLMFDRYTSAGVRTGFRHLGNCSKFGITTSPSTIKVKDYTQESSAPYAEIVEGTELGLAIEGFEFDEYNLALATLGDVASLTQAGTAVTGEVLATAAVTGLPGKYFITAKRNITLVAVKQGATTYVEGTDYTIDDAAMGVIRVLPTGGITDGTDLTVDYTPTAITGAGLSVIRGATVAAIEGFLAFKPTNSTGRKRECYIYRANLAPDGELGLISDDVNKWTLKGSILSDVAGAYGGSVSSPYYHLVDRG
jgi:hypothetical protein